MLKLITRKKAIWHVRDNIRNGLLNTFLIRFSDQIICISDHVYQQLKTPEKNKKLIYGGIDSNEWSPLNYTKNNDLKISLGLSSEVKLVAQIGQLTFWKNHIDFIKAAAEIIQNYPINVHFLIVGDDLSGKEKEYKKQLKTEILKAGLENHFSFLDFVKDIKAIYAQIDVLVHTAIDEPFGRVFIEAMAMEKPVVAYACGGPKEIIVNNQTGYLVKPYDYKTIGEKVILLLKNEHLQIKLGKEGRKRVIEKFNLKDNICKIEALFESM
jgi:glycosyltransferase involved in cell wall biosynthesis